MKDLSFGRLERKSTLPETNSEFSPKNRWLEYYIPIGSLGLFSGAMYRAFAVRFKEGIYICHPFEASAFLAGPLFL